MNSKKLDEYYHEIALLWLTAATPSLAVLYNTDGQSSEEINSGLCIYIEQIWRAAWTSVFTVFKLTVVVQNML